MANGTAPLIFVIDDSAISKAGLESLLRGDFDPSWIGHTDDPKSAAELCIDEKPKAVVLNFLFRATPALALAEQILSGAPQTPILLLNMPNFRDPVEQAARAGVSGMLLETDPLDLIVPAIKAVHAGGAYLSPGVADLILKCFRNAGDFRGTRELSEREVAIVKYIATGYSNKAIAYELHLSVKTIEGHRSRISKKLGVSSTAGLVRLAMTEGLVPPK